MDEQIRSGGCAEKLRRQGRPYPRTCAACGLGPCKFVVETVEIPPEAATAPIKDLIRLAGGIVHSDGNIFFSSAEQFTKAAAALSQPAVAQGDSFHSAGGECGEVQAPAPTDAERLDFLDTDVGAIRSDTFSGLTPRYIYWGNGTNMRAAIDSAIAASKATP